MTEVTIIYNLIMGVTSLYLCCILLVRNKSLCLDTCRIQAVNWFLELSPVFFDGQGHWTEQEITCQTTIQRPCVEISGLQAGLR
jgi:hypothetical protein